MSDTTEPTLSGFLLNVIKPLDPRDVWEHVGDEWMILGSLPTEDCVVVEGVDNDLTELILVSNYRNGVGEIKSEPVKLSSLKTWRGK